MQCIRPTAQWYKLIQISVKMSEVSLGHQSVSYVIFIEIKLEKLLKFTQMFFFKEELSDKPNLK